MDSPAPKTSKNYLIAVVLLMIVVGGLAFLGQLLPNWRSRQPTLGPEAKKTGPTVLRFLNTQALWNTESKFYVKEIEKGDHGHYDFPFENPSDQEGELGLYQINCACSGILASSCADESWANWIEERKSNPALDVPASVVTSWVSLVREGEGTKTGKSAHPERFSLLLPPKSKGVLRVTWDGRGDVGRALRLMPRIWVQPKGDAAQRLFAELDVPIRITAPLQYFPAKIDVGSIGQGTRGSGTMFVWSATRAKPEVAFKGELPLFQVEAKRLDDKEIKNLKDLVAKEEKLLSDIKIAWSVTAAVLEESKDEGKNLQHDLGPFLRTIGITVDGEAVETSPQVSGAVLSDIEIGEVKDRGKIDLGTFDPARGSSRKVILWSDAKAQLQYERHDPAELKVKLTRITKESTSRRSQWLLDVHVPRDSLFGPFPERSAVYLRIQGDPPRLIRVPIVGTAKHIGG